MKWFTKPLAETPTVERTTPADQLAAVERDYQVAELQFDFACAAFKAFPWATYRVRIGTTTNIQTERPSAEGRAILARVRETTARRDALLSERAKLRKVMGL
jgi:hypothetical protein